jgi:hypothetical protein
MVEALAIMAAKREEGATATSYLDAEYGAPLHDNASVIGWARMELYLVEEILGAKITTEFGGLSYDPPAKAAVALALEKVNTHMHHTSFLRSNATEYAKASLATGHSPPTTCSSRPWWKNSCTAAVLGKRHSSLLP